MSKVSNHELQSMAEEIREQAAQLRILTFLSFIQTADVVNRYMDIEVARYPVAANDVESRVDGRQPDAHVAEPAVDVVSVGRPVIIAGQRNIGGPRV